MMPSLGPPGRPPIDPPAPATYSGRSFSVAIRVASASTRSATLAIPGKLIVSGRSFGVWYSACSPVKKK